MDGIAIVGPGWWLRGPLDQWRRTTGVLRAHLKTAPLSAWVTPESAEDLRLLGDLAHYRDAETELVIGYWERRVRLQVQMTRWSAGQACLGVRALKPLPVSAWWLPAASFAECPPVPRS